MEHSVIIPLEEYNRLLALDKAYDKLSKLYLEEKNKHVSSNCCCKDEYRLVPQYQEMLSGYERMVCKLIKENDDLLKRKWWHTIKYISLYLGR